MMIRKLMLIVDNDVHVLVYEYVLLHTPSTPKARSISTSPLTTTSGMTDPVATTVTARHVSCHPPRCCSIIRGRRRRSC